MPRPPPATFPEKKFFNPRGFAVHFDHVPDHDAVRR